MAVPTSQARFNRWIALLGVTAVTVYLSWKVLEPFIEVLLLGIALTVIFQPVHRRFVGWTRGNRIAAVLSTLSVLLVLIVPFTFVSITLMNEVGPAIKQVEAGFNSVMKAIEKIESKKGGEPKEEPKEAAKDAAANEADKTANTPAAEAATAPDTPQPPTGDEANTGETKSSEASSGGTKGGETKDAEAKASESRLARLFREWKIDQFITPAKIDEWKKQAPGFIGEHAFRVGYGIAGFLLGFVFLIFVLFFLFRDGYKLGTRLIELLPMPREQALALVRRTEEVLGGCVYGVIMVAAVQGTLGGITFWALGLGSPVTWGLVMTLLCTLPIVGAWVVWMPAAIGLAIHGDYARAIILAAVGQFVISTIDGFLRPILVGQRAKMHELVIFFSVLGGLKYFGLLGILLGPIVMSIAWSLTSVLWQSQNDGKLTQPTPAPGP